MHYYKVDGQQHFAPSAELSVPAAIAPTIESIRNLSDFRPRPMHTRGTTGRPRTAFTSGVSGSVFFAPGDIATVYNIKPLYTGGINGTGQSIAVVGQSGVSVTDIENFQKAAGLTVKDPILVLVPGTGSSTIFSGGDEAESELDLEWAGALAPGADIYFVYTGGSTNYSAFDSIVYSVDERIASIISVSYGACETALNGFSLESSLAQAAAQGQTVVAASGDQGSTACSGDTTNGLTQEQQFGIAVNYPASSPYVTGIGGTAITPANSTSTNSTYWLAQSTSDVLSSAKTYIPELAWNDSSSQSGLSASGGGASALFGKPAWQKGVPGIPSDSMRDVPDIALYSSPAFPGFLYCTSDQSSWDTNAPAQQASCNDGFRDAATTDLTVAGGTSFGAPIFAGTIALINQKAGYVNGQGLMNPTLYTLASDSTTYASVFHDVTSGNNNCNAGSTYCGTTTTGFSAGTGYDQVTGLGSVDANNLVAAWPANSSTLIGTKTTITAATTTPDVNTSDTFTIAVTSQSGTTTPTGTLTLDLDGGTVGGGTTVAGLALTASGTYAYTTQFSTAGTHQIVAKYSGDATHAASTGIISVTRKRNQRRFGNLYCGSKQCNGGPGKLGEFNHHRDTQERVYRDRIPDLLNIKRHGPDESVLRIHDHAEQRRWVSDRQRDQSRDHANAGRYQSLGLRERRSHRGEHSPTSQAAGSEDFAHFDAQSGSRCLGVRWPVNGRFPRSQLPEALRLVVRVCPCLCRALSIGLRRRSDKHQYEYRTESPEGNLHNYRDWY